MSQLQEDSNTYYINTNPNLFLTKKNGKPVLNVAITKNVTDATYPKECENPFEVRQGFKFSKEHLLPKNSKVVGLGNEAITDTIIQMAKWPKFNSAHEAYAVLLEEVDELWEEVRKKQKNRSVDLMKKEALQVAAMALRFAAEICNEEDIRK